MNKAAIDTHLWVLHGYNFSSPLVNARECKKDMSWFVRKNLHAISGGSGSYSPDALLSLAFTIVLVYKSHVVICHCFNLHFPNKTQSRKYFPTLTCYHIFYLASFLLGFWWLFCQIIDFVLVSVLFIFVAWNQPYSSMQHRKYLTNELIYLQSINFQQRCQEYTMGKRQTLSTLVLWKLDTHEHDGK